MEVRMERFLWKWAAGSVRDEAEPGRWLSDTNW